MGILIFASFMDLLDVTIVQVALPTIREDLGATPAQLEWIVSGYMLAFAVVLITGGRLGDIIGRQRTFQQIGAAVGVAISGTVFFGAVGTDWSLPTVSQALERSGWVAITGYLIAAVASLLLPGRAAVQAHVEEQARLAAADVEAPTAAVVSAQH